MGLRVYPIDQAVIISGIIFELDPGWIQLNVNQPWSVNNLSEWLQRGEQVDEVRY